MSKEEATDRASSGSFSRHNRVNDARANGGAAAPELSVQLFVRHLRSGQKSSRSKAHGSVTSTGLHIRPSAIARNTSAYRPTPGLAAYARYAAMASSQNIPLSTFFRSEIQAT